MRRPRDLRYAGWHSLATGDPGSALYFTATPRLDDLGDTSATWTWTTNVGTSAYMEWSTDAAFATMWTNSPGEESFAFTTHTQTMTSLAEATSYWLRVKVEDADGNQLTSATYPFTTAGSAPPPEPPGTTGPRYDLYDGTGTGTYPTLGLLANESGQLYDGAEVLWTDSNVYIVPDSVANAADVGAALATWISDTVPNGASASVPTFVVFDRSDDGEDSTDYGTGTEYVMSSSIYLRPSASTVRSNIVFWGYNARLKWTDATNPYGVNRGLFWFDGGGWENIHIVGFDSVGPAVDAALTSDPDMVTYGANEYNKHVDITSWKGLKILDCSWRDGGCYVGLREWYTPTQHYWSWSHGQYSDDAEIGWCEGTWSCNQGILIGQGHNIDLHHCEVSGTRQKLVNLEDGGYWPVGSDARRIVNLTIRSNRFGSCWWQDGIQQPSMVSLEQRSDMIDSRENLKINDNEFYDGPGNPTTPLMPSTSLINRVPLIAGLPPGFVASSDTPPGTTLEMKRNVTYLPQWAVDGGGTSFYIASFVNWQSIDVSDNVFQGIPSRIHSSVGSITWDNNDATYDTW